MQESQLCCTARPVPVALGCDTRRETALHTSVMLSSIPKSVAEERRVLLSLWSRRGDLWHLSAMMFEIAGSSLLVSEEKGSGIIAYEGPER